MPGRAGSRRRTGALCLIVAAGATLRLWGIGFALPLTQGRPDESRIVNLAMRIASGDLNPHYFVYPSLYLYLLAGVFRLQQLAARVPDVRLLPVPDLFLAARLLTAAFSAATIVLVYAIGIRLRDHLAGLAAAGLLAVAFLHVRDSHFGTTDVPVTCAILLALLLSIVPDPGWGRVAAAGLVAGLATSLKYNALLLGGVALFLEAHDLWLGRRRWPAAAGRVVLFGGGMVLGFLVGTPYALLDHQTFQSGVRFVADYLQSGHASGGRVLAVRGAAWHYLSFILPAAVGWPVFVTGVAGLFLAIRRDVRIGGACVVFPVLYFITASRGMTVFARYMVILVPFLCLGAGCAVSLCVGPLRARPLARAAAGAALAAALALPSAARVKRLDTLLARPDNRLVAAQWIERHVPGRSSVWQSGSMYGKVQFTHGVAYDVWTYEEDAGRFTRDGQPVAGSPDYVLIQRSPLSLYSSVPDAIAALVGARYSLEQTFRTGNASLAEEDFDASDAFFVPLRHLDAIRRPGPDFELFRRRGATDPR